MRTASMEDQFFRAEGESGSPGQTRTMSQSASEPIRRESRNSSGLIPDLAARGPPSTGARHRQFGVDGLVPLSAPVSQVDPANGGGSFSSKFTREFSVINGRTEEVRRFVDSDGNRLEERRRCLGNAAWQKTEKVNALGEREVVDRFFNMGESRCSRCGRIPGARCSVAVRVMLIHPSPTGPAFLRRRREGAVRAGVEAARQHVLPGAQPLPAGPDAARPAGEPAKQVVRRRPSGDRLSAREARTGAGSAAGAAGGAAAGARPAAGPVLRQRKLDGLDAEEAVHPLTGSTWKRGSTANPSSTFALRATHSLLDIFLFNTEKTGGSCSSRTPAR